MRYIRMEIVYAGSAQSLKKQSMNQQRCQVDMNKNLFKKKTLFFFIISIVLFWLHQICNQNVDHMVLWPMNENTGKQSIFCQVLFRSELSIEKPQIFVRTQRGCMYLVFGLNYTTNPESSPVHITISLHCYWG